MNKYFTAVKEAFRNLASKPNTVMFPVSHVEIPSDIRGAPIVFADKCTLCMKCERICPTGAIKIDKHKDAISKFTVDLGFCCYCGECEATCNFDAIKLSDTWLTASLTREGLATTVEVAN